MSEFNEYAQRFDKIMQTISAEHAEIEARMTAAEDARREFPQRSGGVTPEYMVKSSRAQADYVAAEEELRELRRSMEDGNYRRQIKELRKELENSLAKAFRVDPEKIDNATLELLKSGICTPDEYAVFLNKAIDGGNPTMARLICKYAEDAAAAAVEKAGGYMEDPTAKALRTVVYNGRAYNGKQWLDAFDYMEDIFNRASRNPAMLEQWDNLTADLLDKF
jgi:hypothetical protein